MLDVLLVHASGPDESAAELLDPSTLLHHCWGRVDEVLRLVEDVHVRSQLREGPTDSGDVLHELLKASQVDGRPRVRLLKLMIVLNMSLCHGGGSDNGQRKPEGDGDEGKSLKRHR
jgi:hypothetical protein